MPKIPKIIPQLVEKFQHNLKEYKNPKYHEAHIRVEFVNPFFKALGWDVDNEAGYAFAYRDVIHEDEVKVGGATKAPDYSFRIGGTRKFFLETKKPSIDLKHDPSPAFQLRRYAYSAKLPVSILTDFEEFIVFDCRIKPKIDDKPSVGRVMYLTYEEYVDKWEEISSIFSRESVLRGDFDRFTEGTRKKRGTAELDKDFLADLDRWRILLAKNIALRNEALTQREINWSVQLTIDRLIFLRMSEDRGIENQYTLRALQNGSCVYSRLVEIFYQADERYNSGLFHFREKDGPHPDELTPELKIDDKVIKEIVSELYYPKCPYEFSVLPVEVLGHAYEQFLGKVIRLTEGHRAKIEEKPEVRKAGGVYYTPKYIVDYIVENTVGKLLKDKSPEEVRDLHILDPACGSGSFLLGAFQYLMDWHLDWYTKEYEKTDNIPSMIPETGKRKKKSDPQAIYQGQGGQWYLSTAEKKRILTNNIFGVDIDANAVEVTKLSLLLKVLENESSETINSQLKMWHERALPNLSNNIKCGNSLIGPDFYENQQSAMFDEEEALRINAFDWEQEFPEIFKKGGFDAVIGNPPYIPIEMMNEHEKQYYCNTYKYLERKYDSSVVFIISMLNKLKKDGLLSYISSITWQTGENYCNFRKFLLVENGIKQIINLPFDIFKTAYVDTGIYVLSRLPSKQYKIYRFPKKGKIGHLYEIDYRVIDMDLIESPKYKIVLEPKAQSIYLRVKKRDDFIELGEITDSTQGLTASRYKRKSKKEINDLPFLEKGQIYRYCFNIDGLTYVSMSEYQSLKKYYSATPKVLIRRIVNRQNKLMAMYYDKELVFTKDINPFLISEKYNPFYILAIINSKIISYLYINTSSIATKDDFRQTTLAELRNLPIPNCKAHIQGKIGRIAERLIDLHKKLTKAKDPRTLEQLQRRINATDRKIDQLVYELYGLTEEEIKVVEESMG